MAFCAARRARRAGYACENYCYLYAAPITCYMLKHIFASLLHPISLHEICLADPIIDTCLFGRSIGRSFAMIDSKRYDSVPRLCAGYLLYKQAVCSG